MTPQDAIKLLLSFLGPACVVLAAAPETPPTVRLAAVALAAGASSALLFMERLGHTPADSGKG